MMNYPFDTSLPKIWSSWYAFVKGKNRTPELEEFTFNLESNLSRLQKEIESGAYKHGAYRTFTVFENKRREISVATIRDRVVHRLLYDYLVDIYDKTFIFDAWSCRKNKGLLDCILRAQAFLHHNPKSYVWRADIKKFFDNIDRDVLLNILKPKVTDKKALSLLSEVIGLAAGQLSLSLSLSIGPAQRACQSVI
jgi:RNA-directed DNA polymerase